MSGIGFWELIILFLIGLIVLGPERLPRVASQLGSWLGQARRMTRVMKRQLEDELDLESQLQLKPPPVKPGNNQDNPQSPVPDTQAAGTGIAEVAAADESPVTDQPGNAATKVESLDSAEPAKAAKEAP